MKEVTDFWTVPAGDLYAWNTRLKKVKIALLYESHHYTHAELEEILVEALYRFQSSYHLMIMQWANEAGVGPGFVVD